jgi:putative addiction module antidote
MLDKHPRRNNGYVMPIQTKVCKIGNSLGIVLPVEALQTLKVGEGDMLYLAEDLEGSLRITQERPSFEEKMEAARSLMNRYGNAFRELAK